MFSSISVIKRVGEIVNSGNFPLFIIKPKMKECIVQKVADFELATF